MSIQHWGEFEEEEPAPEPNKTLTPDMRRFKLTEAEESTMLLQTLHTKTQQLKIKNPLITQTIEVTKQTEMLRSLIDTYSSCTGGNSNFLRNPAALMPSIDFPPENCADFVTPALAKRSVFKVCMPETPFLRGEPQSYPHLNPAICRLVLRKALVGHLCVGDFNEATESALVLFTDGVEHFVRTLLDEVHHNRKGQPEVQGCPALTIADLDKAALSLLGTPLLQIPNDFFPKLMQRNQRARNDYKNVRADYDKLAKESYEEHGAKMKFEDDTLDPAFLQSLLETNNLPSPPKLN